MLSRCWNLGIARAAPTRTSSSANDRRRMRVIVMFCQRIGTARKKSMHALKFSPDVSTPKTLGDYRRAAPTAQSANIRRSTPRFKVSHTHRRHIGDTLVMFSTCSCKRRRCIFDVMLSPMAWWSIADPSLMLPNCSPKHRRCYGDASLSVRKLISDCSQMTTWTLYTQGCSYHADRGEDPRRLQWGEPEECT